MTTSADPLPFRPNRFQSAAAHYQQGRVPYAAALIRRVVQATALQPGHRVLDLGCGPATLAALFAPFAHEVVAIDPSAEMRVLASERARQFPNIRVQPGSSYDLAPSLGTFHLVVMGRAFHWMDRADTLRRLDRIITPDGALALFHDTAPAIPANAWRKQWRAIRDQFQPNPEPHGQDPDWIRHEAFLLDSAFSRLEHFGVIEPRAIDVDTIIQRTLSMSSTSSARLGHKTPEMIAALRATLADICQEVVETSALVAWRPQTPVPPLSAP